MKWISVKDRLPEIKKHHESDIVICYTEEGTYAFSSLLENMFGQTVFDCEREDPSGVRWTEQVTHWMPLPEPPKEG